MKQLINVLLIMLLVFSSLVLADKADGTGSWPCGFNQNINCAKAGALDNTASPIQWACTDDRRMVLETTFWGTVWQVNKRCPSGKQCDAPYDCYDILASTPGSGKQDSGFTPGTTAATPAAPAATSSSKVIYPIDDDAVRRLDTDYWSCYDVDSSTNQPICCSDSNPLVCIIKPSTAPDGFYGKFADMFSEELPTITSTPSSSTPLNYPSLKYYPFKANRVALTSKDTDRVLTELDNTFNEYHISGAIDLIDGFVTGGGSCLNEPNNRPYDRQPTGQYKLTCAGAFLEAVRLLYLPSLSLNEFTHFTEGVPRDYEKGNTECTLLDKDYGLIVLNNVKSALQEQNPTLYRDITIHDVLVKDSLTNAFPENNVYLATLSHVYTPNQGCAVTKETNLRLYHHMPIFTVKDNNIWVFDATAAKKVAYRQMSFDNFKKYLITDLAGKCYDSSTAVISILTVPKPVPVVSSAATSAVASAAAPAPAATTASTQNCADPAACKAIDEVWTQINDGIAKDNERNKVWDPASDSWKTFMDVYPSITPGSAGTSIDSSTNLANQKIAYDYFIKKELTPVQAAAIVGNLMLESQMNPNAVNKDGGAFGIAQWLDTESGSQKSPRQTNLKVFASTHNRDVNDINLQLDFLWYEVNEGSEKPWSALTKLKQEIVLATNPDGTGGAVQVWENNFERAGPDGKHYDKRYNYAKAVYNRFNSPPIS